MKHVFSLCLAKTGKKGVANRNISWLFVPLRLLERDEWIFLDKDPEANKQKIYIELPRSVTKGLVACRDATRGVRHVNMAKYALVTGGSRGLGRAICIKLADLGYSVIINYQSNEIAAEATKKNIEKIGGTAELLKFDVSSKVAIDNAINSWEETHPEDYIEILVNNAGIRRDNVMFMMPDDDWHQVIDTTLNGFFYLTRHLLKHMMPRKRGGRIVNIASLSGIKGLPGQTNYSAAKAALIGATKALAQEVALRNITVNAIAPGFIETDMTKDLPQEELKKLIPIGRFGKPEEVAALVGFLVSEDAAYITGEVINVNGGLYT